MDSGVRRQLPSWMIRTTAAEREKTSTLETKVENKENGSIEPRKERTKKRMSDKHCEDQVDDALESDKGKKVKGLVRKRVVEEAVKKKQSKKLKNFHIGTTEYNSSEDELTVEDLVSIAKEVHL